MVKRKFANALLVVPLSLITLLAIGASGSAPQQRGWWTNPPQPAPTVAKKAKAGPNQAALAAKARLDSNSGNLWHVEWNEQTGMPATVSGESKQYSGAPREIADQFLMEYRPLFTGTSPASDQGDISFAFDTAWIGPYVDRRTTIVAYSQFYKGIQLYQAGANIHVSSSGRVVGIGTSTYRIESLDVTPRLSVLATVQALKAATAPDSLSQFGETKLLIWPSTDPPRLAYRLNCSVRSGAKDLFYGFVFVDARTGEVLGASPWMHFDSSLPGDDKARDQSGDSGLIGKDRRPLLKGVPIQTVPESYWPGAPQLCCGNVRGELRVRHREGTWRIGSLGVRHLDPDAMHQFIAMNGFLFFQMGKYAKKEKAAK